MTITGAPTAAGELALYVAGTRVSVGVNTTDTPTTMALALQTELDRHPALCVTGSAALGVLTLTANWGGETGNAIDVRSSFFADDQMAAGVAMAITAMAGGTTNPDLTAYVLAAYGYRPTEIVLPFTDSTSMAIVEAEQETRWGCTNKMDGQVVVAMRSTVGAALAWLAPRNSRQVHSLHTKADRTNPWEMAAMAAMVIEGQAARDTAVPFTGMVLKGYQGPQPVAHWAQADANNIALEGGSVIELAEDGTGALLRMFNHYKRNSAGATDTSCRDLCWVKTASYWRWVHVNAFETSYRGYKIAEYVTDPIPGQKIMTRDLVQEIMIGLYMVFMDAGLFQNLDHYKTTLLVELDGPNGKVKIVDQPVLVTQHYQTEISSNLLPGRV